MRLFVSNAISRFATVMLAMGVSSAAFALPDSSLLQHALESATTCGNVVRFDDQNIYLGFGDYRHGMEEPRKPIPGHVRVIPITTPEQAFAIPTLDAAIDMVSTDGHLFVLTYSAIEEWDLVGKTRVAIYDTYTHSGTMAYMEHAQAFALVAGKLIIAHGRLGVSIFDIKTRHLANQFRLVPSQSPLESMATAVAVVGNNAYVVMDSFSLVSEGKPAFRGIVVIDAARGTVTRELDGMDPGADGVSTDGQKLIVSFGGIPIWKYLISSLNGASLPEPQNRIWRFPVNGHPIGSPAMDATNYYTCFTKQNTSNGHYQKKPLALSRASLQLD